MRPSRRKRKILSPTALRRVLARERRAGRTVVFTNGCFDILHVGHVRYLNAARQLGDRLVVGLNTDASVRRLKGPLRPVTGQKQRAEVMAALESVDYVTFFSTPTPLTLIRAVNPDVLVKGGDWKVRDIIGSDWVLSRGGKVRSLPFVKGFSTTRMLQKIQKLG